MNGDWGQIVIIIKSINESYMLQSTKYVYPSTVFSLEKAHGFATIYHFWPEVKIERVNINDGVQINIKL